MGFNSTLIVLNDALHTIEKDEEFGKNVAQAIHEQYGRRKEYVDIASNGHMNAASVLGSHHADEKHLFAIGGNTGWDFGRMGNWKSPEEDLLRAWANKLGFDIHKKRGK